MDEVIINSEERKKHNDLVKLLASEGFIVSRPSRITGIRDGYLWVKDPKPDHPKNPNGQSANGVGDFEKTEGSPLYVGYLGYRYLILLNTEYPALSEYHIKLRKTFESYLSEGEKNEKYKED